MFTGQWPSHSSSSSSSSLATAERDAADGQPAFRHHQRCLGDGRGATRPDRGKRQGEHNLFLERSPAKPQRSTCFLGWHDGKQGSSIHHRGRRSSSLKWELCRDDCSLWLQSRHGDRYSSHHLFYVIFEPEPFKVIPLVFNKPGRLIWAHLRRRVWSVVQV